jgi:hypothetical protein
MMYPSGVIGSSLINVNVPYFVTNIRDGIDTGMALLVSTILHIR